MNIVHQKGRKEKIRTSWLNTIDISLLMMEMHSLFLRTVSFEDWINVFQFYHGLSMTVT